MRQSAKFVGERNLGAAWQTFPCKLPRPSGLAHKKRHFQNQVLVPLAQTCHDIQTNAPKSSVGIGDRHRLVGKLHDRTRDVMSSHHDQEPESAWLECLLYFLIAVAAVNALATLLSASVLFGLAAGLFTLLVVAVVSLFVDRPSISWQGWREYLERGNLPPIPIPRPRFSLAALLQLTVLGGILLALFRYLRAYPRDEREIWVVCVTFYLWLIGWAVCAVLLAARSEPRHGSPAKSAGVGGTLGAMAYLAGRFVIAGFPLEMICFAFCSGGFISLVSGIYLGMPIGILVNYWAQTHQRPPVSKDRSSQNPW